MIGLLLQYWCNSINQSGYKGDKLSYLMNCDKDTVQKVIEEGFDIIGLEKMMKAISHTNHNMLMLKDFYISMNI